jgi:glutathione S-transferase
MSLKLHVFPLSPRAFKVLLVAHHLGIDYESCFLDLTKGAQRAPEYTALNPNQRMPLLDDDGYVLWESNAIVEYLASKVDGWLPRDAQGRLALTKWLYWDSNHWDPACAIFVFERVVKPHFGLGETSEREIARGAALFKRLAGVLNGELEKHRYVMDDSLSIADLALASPFCVGEHARFPLEEYRAIQRWQADIKALSAWSRTLSLQKM